MNDSFVGVGIGGYGVSCWMVWDCCVLCVVVCDEVMNGVGVML